MNTQKKTILFIVDDSAANSSSAHVRLIIIFQVFSVQFKWLKSCTSGECFLEIEILLWISPTAKTLKHIELYRFQILLENNTQANDLCVGLSNMDFSNCKLCQSNDTTRFFVTELKIRRTAIDGGCHIVERHWERKNARTKHRFSYLVWWFVFLLLLHLCYHFQFNQNSCSVWHQMIKNPHLWRCCKFDTASARITR